MVPRKASKKSLGGPGNSFLNNRCRAKQVTVRGKQTLKLQVLRSDWILDLPLGMKLLTRVWSWVIVGSNFRRNDAMLQAFSAAPWSSGGVETVLLLAIVQPHHLRFTTDVSGSVHGSRFIPLCKLHLIPPCRFCSRPWHCCELLVCLSWAWSHHLHRSLKGLAGKLW